jgi:hypothetical protein
VQRLIVFELSLSATGSNHCKLICLISVIARNWFVLPTLVLLCCAIFQFHLLAWNFQSGDHVLADSSASRTFELQFHLLCEHPLNHLSRGHHGIWFVCLAMILVQRPNISQEIWGSHLPLSLVVVSGPSASRWNSDDLVSKVVPLFNLSRRHGRHYKIHRYKEWHGIYFMLVLHLLKSCFIVTYNFARGRANIFVIEPTKL